MFDWATREIVELGCSSSMFITVRVHALLFRVFFCKLKIKLLKPVLKPGVKSRDIQTHFLVTILLIETSLHFPFVQTEVANEGFHLCIYM